MAATELVILVDEKDNPIGTAEKLEAHRKALRHRAFSVFVVRCTDEWEVLLQQRASDKYHCPNLWSNTCCSHPRPDEDIIDAGRRRLNEEMGLFLSLARVGQFHYIAAFDNGLTENEIDHVLIGFSEQERLKVNPAEVQSYQWMQLSKLQADIIAHPERYTPWLEKAAEILRRFLNQEPSHTWSMR